MSVHLRQAAKSDWRTPRWLCDVIRSAFPGIQDGAPGLEQPNVAHGMDPVCPPGQDSLLADWGRKKIFVNPPFDKVSLGAFANKAVGSLYTRATVALLVPPKTDQWWFHHLLQNGEMVPIVGRVRFELEDGTEMRSPPGPTVLFVMHRGREHARRLASELYFAMHD